MCGVVECAADPAHGGNAGCYTELHCNVTLGPHAVHWNVRWQYPINEISTDRSWGMD